MQVLFQTASRLGNFPPGLLEHVQENKEWCCRLAAINQAFDTEIPREGWYDREDLDPDTHRFILRMLRLDPAERPTASVLLEDSWWESSE